MNAATATLGDKIVSQSDWLRATGEFLVQEKELTRLTDDLARRRRELPWTPVDKAYAFQGPQGQLGLGDLFGGKSQLAVYHFMFGPDWEEGCPGCSYVMDHMNGSIEHLAARDVALVLVSRAPLAKIEAFKKRMGWHFNWVSSGGSDFNRDFAVSFSPEETASGRPLYNFGTTPAHGEENPGLSLFAQEGGRVFHTYSVYGRGLEMMLGTYTILDRAAKGRDEESLTPPMSWVRHYDKYAPTAQPAASCCHK